MWGKTDTLPNSMNSAAQIGHAIAIVVLAVGLSGALVTPVLGATATSQLAGAGVADAGTGSATMSMAADNDVFDGRGIYVWGYMGTLTSDEAARERFFDFADRYGINTVFLLWGGGSGKETFLREAHNHGLTVDAMVGSAGGGAIDDAENQMEAIIAYNAGKSDAASFDGIHLDAEPGGANIDSFMRDYNSLMNGATYDVSARGETIASQGMSLSAAVGWYWAAPGKAPHKTERFLNMDSLDYITTMAYYDTESGTRDRIRALTSLSDVPYVPTVETQEFSDSRNHDVTFYEEGWDKADEVLRNIANNPPAPGHVGSAIHFYQDGMAQFAALKSASVSDSAIEPGQRTTVTANVRYDDGFSTDYHESRLRVDIEGPGGSYTETKTVKPSPQELITPSLAWDSPSNVREGTYDVTVTLLDTNKVGGGHLNDPVKLAELDAGTVTVEDQAEHQPEPAPTEDPGTNCNAPAWDSNAVYTGGEQVSHDGAIWEAQWWSKDDEPHQQQWYVWSKVSDCDDSGGSGGGGVDRPTFDSTGDNDATFETDGSGHYVIDAAGADVWDDEDEYGAIYENDVSGDGTFTATVESQEWTDDWAKSGVMVANDITAAGSSAGDVIVAATPGNGYTMQWDSDGDGYLDESVHANSESAPGMVRLQKNGQTFTGQYSTNGGSGWNTIDTVTLDEASSTQDVGLFATSHNSGTNSRVEFSHFDISKTGSTEPSSPNDGGMCSAPAYSPMTLYMAGDRVSYNGDVYEAQLATRTVAPDTSTIYWGSASDC